MRNSNYIKVRFKRNKIRSCFVRFEIYTVEDWKIRFLGMRNDCLRFYSQIRICLDGLWVTRGPRSPIIAPLVGRIYVRSIREKACNESAKLSHDGRDILWYSILISRRNFRLVKWNRVSRNNTSFFSFIYWNFQRFFILGIFNSPDISNFSYLEIINRSYVKFNISKNYFPQYCCTSFSNFPLIDHFEKAGRENSLNSCNVHN